MSTTGVIVTAFAILIALYDLVVILRRGIGCSVSRFLQRVGFSSPIVCPVIGSLLGHWFMYMPASDVVIAVPEDGERVSVVRIEDLKMNAVFVPDKFSATLTNLETGEKFGCPKPVGRN